MTTDSHDVPQALGSVVEADRGSLPFALLHGEALVACASWGLGESGVTAVDLVTPWSEIVESRQPFVLHDALCPMTPATFITHCLVRAVDEDTVVVGVRPVTDTVKTVRDGFVGSTVDRSGLQVVASPIVLPPSVVAGLECPPTTDFAALVDRLRDDHRIELVEAPPSARRVTSLDDVRLLEALTRQSGQPPG